MVVEVGLYALESRLEGTGVFGSGDEIRVDGVEELGIKGEGLVNNLAARSLAVEDTLDAGELVGHVEQPQEAVVVVLLHLVPLLGFGQGGQQRQGAPQQLVVAVARTDALGVFVPRGNGLVLGEQERAVGEGKVEPTALTRAFYVQLKALARDEIGVDDDAFFSEAVVFIAPHLGIVGHDDPQVNVGLLPNLIVRIGAIDDGGQDRAILLELLGQGVERPAIALLDGLLRPRHGSS